MSRGLLPSLDEQVQAGLLGNKRQVGQAYIEVPLDQQPPGDLADSHIPVNEPKHSQPALIHPAKLSVCGIIDQIDDVLNITIDFEMFYGLSLDFNLSLNSHAEVIFINITIFKGLWAL